MSKKSKVLTSIIIGLLIIFGISTMSNAYEIGDTVSISWSTYDSSKNIFCVEHGQKLKGSPKYKVISKVNIKGTESKDHKGNTRDNIENAKFAYILSADNGSDHDGGKVQNAIWNYISTWMKAVGNHHSKSPKGTLKNFITGNTPPALTNDAKELIENAKTYAKNLKKEEKAQDKTDKSKIKVSTYTENSKQYIKVGPFKWNFGGDLSEIKVYDQNKKSISNVKFIRYSGKEQKNVKVSEIKSGKNFYIAIPADSGVTKITKLTGKSKLEEKTANITFLQAVNYSDQNLIYVKPSTKDVPIDMSFNYDIKLTGNLKVIKVDKDNNEIKLEGVGFKIKNKDTGKYVKKSGDTISYVNENSATEFTTNKNGEISIKNLIVGTYVAYETKNPNYGYEIVNKNGDEKKVTIDKTAELKITNERILIKLSGYVWVDKISGKQSARNELYKNGEYDSSDILLEGIKVRLKNKDTGATIREDTTGKDGAYQFKDVLVKDLDKYYVEFEYNGLTYQNVTPYVDKENGSKSIENADIRKEFNKGFEIVEGTGNNTGVAHSVDNKTKHDLTYSTGDHKSELTGATNASIIATTKDVFSIKNQYKAGMTEIKNINLGLYEREMPDIRLEKDVQNVELLINGHHHVYEYGKKKLDNYTMEKDENGFNVGVKFASEYTGTYKRAVYEPDYNYTKNNPNSDSKLNVYLTYRIAIYNESTNLKVRVNNILDYYDNNFTIEKIGTGIDENGQITGDIAIPQSSDDNGYKKAVIQSNIDAEPEKTSSIYVRFKLSDQEVLNAFKLNEQIATYKNIAEINSYTILDKDGNIYAGIDKDSNPGNTNPSDDSTFEDDTDRAPGIQLEVQGDRTLSGSVFLDESEGGLAKVRLGDGIYDTSKEHGIGGVLVTLRRDDGTEFTAETEANGNFTITKGKNEGDALIPGKYTITYTWGDQTYKVKDYKGTIWTEANKKEKSDNGENWYKVNTETRYSDAMDNYETRLKIDNGENIEKMDSTTPTMDLDLEINSVYSVVKDENADKFIPEGYSVINIDFGIVERARQSIALEKRVKTFKVTLANGQVIANATIDKNGKLSGETNHVTYMGPSLNAVPQNGFVKLELDNELIQGATVEVTYEIIATNNSELDYISENFYKYGIQEGEKVTIKPSAIVDYLDRSWAFEGNKNSNWEIKTLEDDTFKAGLDKQVYEDKESTIKDKVILYTTKLSDKALEPGTSNSVELNVSKVLANSDEISLDNETETYKVDKNGGRPLDSTPGNYIPGKGPQEPDDNQAPTTIVTPNTGNDLEVIVPIAVGIMALVILGTGIILIKRKTLNK